MAFSFGCAIFIVGGSLDFPKDLLLLYLGWFYAIWFSASLALLLGAISPFTTLVERLYNPISYLSLPVSGAFYMVSWLPSSYREYALYMPTVHYFELIRAGYFGPLVHTQYNIGYLTMVCLTLTLSGLVMLRHARKYVVIR